MADVDLMETARTIAERIGSVALARGFKIAVAESLTSGAVACQLGAASEASSWFAGGVVAYGAEVKFKLLDVDPGPVVTARCAVEMARGAARLLGADLAVALTGVGGPEPDDEGHPAGTVYAATSSPAGEDVDQHRFEGDPSQVVDQATVTALQMLLDAAENQ
ncbi:nicotinamide-nucleotide amidase [Kribbella sp. VKM Ac-2569]|uniref:CinA family protein n=1 Tax=Kribbella sp. VKM Ac-2569 TaxID=2512220 RepID=UPI00102C82AF|nr:CinA family protein [Kribbella sp. VKM Ac-2569]RZT07518.1 nicotinamide-nucleotide amidase [Kribbella sp. VKM Ac-2569]